MNKKELLKEIRKHKEIYVVVRISEGQAWMPRVTKKEARKLVRVARTTENIAYRSTKEYLRIGL